MSDKVRTTVWLPPKVWTWCKKRAVKEGLSGGASEILVKSIGAYREACRYDAKKRRHEEMEPQVQEWFKAYNEAREKWGVRPVKLTHPARNLIEARLNTYGLTTLLEILYKVPWNDYLMGQGRYAGNGPRLAVSAVLNVTSKINTIEALRDAEDPRILRIRGSMADLEKKIKKNSTRTDLPADILGARYDDMVEQWNQLRDEMKEITPHGSK